MAHDIEKRRRLTILILLAVWASTVAWITLTPGPPLTFEGGYPYCLVCGDRGLADILLNWVLFIPLGLGLAWTIGMEAAVRISVLVTLGIEAAQIFIPGRYPALSDVFANGLGGATGAWLACAATRPRIVAAAVTATALAWLSPAFLMVPIEPSGDFFGQWTQGYPNRVDYTGRVLEADIGGVTVPAGPVVENEELRSALAGHGRLSLLVTVGTPPAALAPLLELYDSRTQEIVLVGAIRDDLLVRRWTWARVLRLDQPDVRWAAALSGLAVGDTIPIDLESSEGSYCARVGTRSRCGLEPGPGDGWAFLLNLEGLRAPSLLAMAVVWSLVLGCVLGLSLTTLAQRIGVSLALVAAGAVIAGLVPHVRTAPLHGASLMVGAVFGGLLRPGLMAVVGFLRGPSVERRMDQGRE